MSQQNNKRIETGIEGFILDITQQQLTEEALLMSEGGVNKEEIVTGHGQGEYQIDSELIKTYKEPVISKALEYRSLFFEMIDAFALHEIICDEYNNPIDYRFISVNPSFEIMTGLKAHNIIGRTVMEVMPGIEISWIEIYGKVALTGESIHFENYAKELDKFYEVKAYRPALGEFAAIFIDITARKKAEKSLQDLNETLEQQVLERTAQLEAVNKELEGFSYSVSHDLRAPLRHMIGFVELLNKRLIDKVDEKSQHYLDTISNAASHMGELIDDLLLFSKMGRCEMLNSKVDMKVLVKEVIDTFKCEMDGRVISLNIGVVPFIKGGRNMVGIVLSNLFDNALKFSRNRAQTKIEIGSYINVENKNEVVFYVKDNGVGFDMLYKDKLFTIFQRLHKQQDFEGTGLGLANVQRIILRHGGRTWAEGALNEGATIYFTLTKFHEPEA